MDTKQIGIVAAVAAVGAGALLAFKQHESDDGGGALDIVIRDADGNIVPHNSPYALQEEQSYTIEVSVLNTTLRGGVEPWPAELTLVMNASLEDPMTGYGVNFYSNAATTAQFAASETKVFTYPIYIEKLYGGMAGTIAVQVKAPDGATLAVKGAEMTVAVIDIVYGADVVIGV